MYANHKKLALQDIAVRLRHDRIHADDRNACTDKSSKIERISRTLTLRGDLSGAERKRLLGIADRCPVHSTLESDPQIVTELED